MMMFQISPITPLRLPSFWRLMLVTLILEALSSRCNITVCHAFQQYSVIPASLASSRQTLVQPRQSRYLTTTSALMDTNKEDPPPAGTIELEFALSQIQLDQVSLQYPVTLARKLFSSVPHRDYAVDHVSCQFCAEAVLLQGASSSGKSALMEIILQANHPHPRSTGATPFSGTLSGRVVLDCIPNVTHRDREGSSNFCEKDSVIIESAVPILLAEKPPYDNSQTAQALLEQEARQNISCRLEPSEDEVSALVATLVATFGRLVRLDEDLCSFKTPAQLSPSENFRLRLAEACLQSSVPHMSKTTSSSSATSIYTLPAPIILLDEWLDFETSGISSKVEETVLMLVQETGAVIFCATHKPNLWKNLMATTPHTTQMTMCRGSILTLRQQQQEK